MVYGTSKTYNKLNTMATYQVNSNERVFLISYLGFKTMNIFCNIKDIPNVLKNDFEKYDQFTISYFCNRKFKKVSKKLLNEMFVNNQIDFKIK